MSSTMLARILYTGLFLLLISQLTASLTTRKAAIASNDNSPTAERGGKGATTVRPIRTRISTHGHIIPDESKSNSTNEHDCNPLIIVEPTIAGLDTCVGPPSTFGVYEPEETIKCLISQRIWEIGYPCLGGSILLFVLIWVVVKGLCFFYKSTKCPPEEGERELEVAAAGETLHILERNLQQQITVSEEGSESTETETEDI